MSAPQDADLIGHYIRIHLTGAAAGIELFGRGEAHDEPARTALLAIRDELLPEREQLLGIAAAFDKGPVPFDRQIAMVGERIGRLKPNGDLLHRTPLTDVVDLEAMRDAVAGKIAGWQALLTVTDLRPELDRGLLEGLLAQGERQHATLVELHADACRRALVS